MFELVAWRVVGGGVPDTKAIICAGLYRNPATEVLAYLTHQHAGRFKVFNLCAEDTYSAARFGGKDNVVNLPCEDHQACYCLLPCTPYSSLRWTPLCLCLQDLESLLLVDSNSPCRRLLVAYLTDLQ